MRIIITGGSGLIGRALTDSLAADKHEVIILSRDPEWVTGLPANAKAVEWDAKTAKGWGHWADGAGAIINLAGEPIPGENLLKMRWTDKRKRRILTSRVNAGQAVSEAVQQASNKPGVVIQASAIGYYGVRGSEVLNEDASAGSDFQADVCKQWEASTLPIEKLGVRRCVIRTGVVLTDRGGALPLQVLPFQLFAGGPIGSGKQYYSWVHLDDVIGAIRFLIDTPEASGTFNLTAPLPVTNADFGHVVGRVLFRPSFIPAPAFAFKAAFGEASTVLLDGQRVVPSRLQELGYKFKYTELEPALRDLLVSN